MKAPEHLAPEQYAELEKAGRLTALAPPPDIEFKEGAATIHFALPRQAVSLLIITR